MSYQFRPAVREQTPLIIGLAGPSKSGKTYSALRLATGMANGGKIAMINTEGKRGHMYAERFKYDALDIGEPFSYERYREAVLAAKELNPAALIIDSISHAHEGPGGMLDQHERYLDEKCGNDFKKRDRLTWTAWIRPKAQEAQFINTIIQLDFPVILCFRAKEKLKIVRGQEPIPMGWQPICSDRIPFETTATLILTPGCKGEPDLSARASELREPMDALIKPTQINEELGQRLAAWAKGSTTNAPAPQSLQTGPEQASSAAAGATFITDEQARNLLSYCEQTGVNISRVLLKAKVSGVEQIPAAMYQRCVDFIDTAAKK